MRNEHKRGDLSVRLQFGRVYGSGPDRGSIRPALVVEDQTSGKVLTIDLTAEDLAEMMAGGAAEIPADRVTGHRGVRDWGKTHEMVTRTVKTQPADWRVQNDREAAELPHVAALIKEVEADGYRADVPRRNNQGVWVVVGRRYVDKP